MMLALAHRLELAAGADLAIDHALLDWLADVVGLGRTHEWLAHVRSLTGDLTGAVGILDALFPDAAFSLVRGNGAVHSATIVPAGGAAPLGVVVPSIAGLAHGNGAGGLRREYPMDEPLRTVHAGGGNHALVAPVVTFAQHGGSVRSADAPVHTITASPKDQNALIATTMAQTGYGEREGQAPRCLDIEAPIGTQVGGAAKHAVVAASLSRFTQNGIGSAMDEPVDTVMAGAPKFGVVSTFLAQHNNDSRRVGGVNPGRPAGAPVATLTATGAQQAVVAAHMMRQFGTSVGHHLDAPTHTDTATVNKSALISGFLTKYYGEALPNQALTEPVHTVTTKPRHGLVTVELDGETYAIADIGMRMLTPRERFRAQGFPDSYVIDRRPDGSALSATVQGSCCGNSVCPPLAAALVAANCAHLAAPAIVEAAE